MMSCAAPRAQVNHNVDEGSQETKHLEIETSKRVIVYGSGADLESAKVSAIRSAMAIKLPQLTISELIMKNTDIETDLLASTMFGYLTYFHILEQAIDEVGFVAIKVEIGISEEGNKIKTYTHSSMSSSREGDRFNGAMISDEVLKAKALKESKRLQAQQQLVMAKALTKRLFSSYPKQATEVTIDSIKLDNDPDWVDLTFSYDLIDGWRNTFWSQAEIIHELMQNHPTKLYRVKLCGMKVYDGKQYRRGRCSFELPAKLQEYRNHSLNSPVGYFTNSSEKYNSARPLRLLIPVFSSSGEYLLCLEKNVTNLIKVVHDWNWQDRRWSSYLWLYGKPTSKRVSKYGPISGTMRIKSSELFSPERKAEFFYPFLAAPNSVEPKSECKKEGSIRHAKSNKKVAA